jgi:hypothetical protein
VNANDRDMPPLDKRQYLKMPEDPYVVKYESPNFGKLYGVSIAKGAEQDAEKKVKRDKAKDDAKTLTSALK